MKIPVQNSGSTNEDQLISSFLGKDSKKEIKVKVVHEKSVEEIEASIQGFAESIDRLSQPTTGNAVSKPTAQQGSENDKVVSKVEPPKKKVVSSAQSDRERDERIRKAVEQRNREIEQTKKENRRIIIIIIIAILGAVMLFNAKCSKSRSHHHEFFDPSMEYRHT